MSLFCSAALAQQSEPAPTDGIEYERGVRLRVYRIEQPKSDSPQLAAGQSANIDQTISEFKITGDEAYLADVERPLLVQMECLLKSEVAQQVELTLKTAARCTLQVEDRGFASPPNSRGLQAKVSLKQGVNRIECTALFVKQKPELELLMQSKEQSEPTSIATSELQAQAFHFRPTSPGVKRLARDEDRPGLGAKVVGLHPSINLATIRAPDDYVPVGGLDVLSDGTLVVATFDARRLRAPSPQEEPDGELWLYHGAEGKVEGIRREKIAEGLYEPAGVCVVGESIYVSQRLEVTRFDRLESQGKWQATTVASGWESNDFHALSFGLLHQPGQGGHPGHLYLAKGTGLGLKSNPPNHGSVWRIDLSLPVGENVEAITGGHRTPNGLGWGPNGEIYVTDNQGEYTPANELNLVKDGSFYGFFHRTGAHAELSPFQPDATRDKNPSAVTEATVWMPQDEIANSPSEPVLVPEGWPFAGQMLVGDVKYGGINRIGLEQIDGVWQGCAFRFTQGMEGGVNRLAFGPGGSLFVGAIGGDHAATWNWVDPDGRKTYQGLQRLQPNGEMPFDIESVHALPEGFEVRFTQPVDESAVADPSNYLAEQWTYRATPNYGGPKFELEPLAIKQITASADRRSVVLQMDGVKANRVVHLTADPINEQGEKLWSSEAWYTVRRIPQDKTPKPSRVVIVTGDNEYGSELSMPMIGSILEQLPGFEVKVLYSVDEQGNRDRHAHSIPGLRALREADLAVFFMRFRALPDAQVKEIEDYVASGRPVIGLRTSSHAFLYESGPHQHLDNGFGDEVLGQRWISHYGHGTSSMAKVDASAMNSPILRGMKPEFPLASWLYVTDPPTHPLPADCHPLLTGIALKEPGEVASKFGEEQPLAWTRELQTATGQTQRVFYTSLGHPRDFLDEPSRRLLVNAIYWALGREGEIPESGAPVPLPKGYRPPNPK
ncbi:ThuA domain-containing protein [Aeoliella mucimassa]|uniref:Trehalose utilization n=1 Tax=Aeoliella mucimassa TaxID=2527972 RepID=A0A518AQH7_9BACT|nr:ThuA domain-containing protein [Aeoliella mucimassa]QDU56974.1 Trehalose utilization [Aeoliella mucimassa]